MAERPHIVNVPGIGSLGSSDDLFRVFTAHNPVAAFVCDAAGRCLYVNARWCELAGLTEAEALGDGWMRALHPDDAEGVVREWGEAGRDGHQSVVEYRLRRPDGEISWIQRFASPLRDAEGQIAGWVGTSIDVTDRRKRERQHEAAAQLGLRALSSDDAGALTRDAVETAAVGLEVEYAGFLELEADGETLRLRAPYGWDTDGKEVAKAAGSSPAAQALRAMAPVLIEHELNGAADERSDLAKKHGVASSAAIVVPGGERPFGVLATHSTRRRAFDQNDLLFLGAVANVLAAALARERTAESSKRLAAIVGSSHDAIIGKNLDGVITSWNAGGERIYGYTEEEAIGRSIEFLIPDDHKDELPGILDRIGRGERITQYETVRVRKDGSRVAIDLTISPIADAAGNVIGASVIARDISGRNQAEEQLRGSEARYRDLFENATDLIATVDLDSRLTRVNTAFARTLGYTREELLGRKLDELVPPESHERLALAKGRKLEHELDATVYEHELIAKDGSRIHVEAASRLIVEDGRPVGTEAICRDVSQRRRAEGALRESEERFRTIFEASPHGMDIVDADGRVLAANAALERLLGYDKEELASMRFADFTHPDDRRTDVHGELISGARESYELEKRFVRKDGSTVWAQLTAFRVRSVDGEPRFIGIIEDISKRKALEQQLGQSQKMEAVGHLAGGIAHDFNNLLTVINGYAESALASNDVTKIRESLGEVVKAGTSAAALTRQLLAFSRQQVLQPLVLELGEVIASVERMLERILGEDVVLETAIDPELGRIRVDPNQIEQVLLNLAVNARDAMPNGGLLRIGATNAVVDDAYAATHIELEPGRFVELTVADGGVGMDEQTRSRVFEPFFTTKQSGTGLGLATVYGIVKQSGGHISLYSEPGAGTTFRLLFPLVDAAPAERPAASPAAASSTGTETILVVEDAEAVRGLTARILETLGYTVATAGSADEALDVASRCDPLHLVISDVMLPGRRGPELLEELQRLRPGTKSLFTSGYAPSLAAQRGGLDPEQPFLAKPFTMAALASIVRDVLDS